MDPLTLSLIAGGGAALGALPDLIPSQYEREQKKRLAELQRDQELGILGLTADERRNIENQLLGRSAQSEAFAQAERQRLASGSSQFGRDLLQAQLSQQAAQQQQQDISARILAADIAKQQAQEQEIRDLEAAQAEYKRRRFEAAVAPAQAGAETAVQMQTLEKLLQMPAPQAKQSMMAQYSLQPSEAEIFYSSLQKPKEQANTWELVNLWED